MLKIFIFVLAFSCSYCFAMAGGDTLAVKDFKIGGAKARSGNDLVVKGSGERIYCTIDSLDSARLYVTVKRAGEDEARLKIRRKEVRYFRYDYYDGELTYATPTNIGYGNALPGGNDNKHINGAVTVGFGQVGGIVGADLEFALSDYVGLQFGLGLVSADVALNFHFEKTLESSYMSIFARNQFLLLNGFGISYNYRGKDGLALQLGVSLINENAYFWGSEIEPPIVQVIAFSIGKCFTF